MQSQIRRVSIFFVNETAENEERGNWASKIDSFLSILGYSVGFGNVWMFPYLFYQNGGSAFLIPYIIMFTCVGMPLFVLELALGQFTSSGALNCWDCVPIFKGLGIAQITISAMMTIFYNMLMTWSFFYLFASFTSQLPWKSCDNWWNTRSCFEQIIVSSCNQNESFNRATNGSCYNEKNEFVGAWDINVYQNIHGLNQSASEEFYNYRVLRLSKGIDDRIGAPHWDIVLCLLFAWTICSVSLSLGIGFTGKLAYITAGVPYIVLIILLGKGLSLSGAKEGLIIYLKPDISKLMFARAWYEASIQVFFSMSTCWGGLTTLASYNNFHNNFLRDALFVTTLNLVTGVLAGVIIFSFLGHLAVTRNIGVHEVIESGPSLAFVAYSSSISDLENAPLWSILFFTMLLTIGIDTQIVSLDTIFTAILDRHIWLKPAKKLIIFAFSIVFFLLGLPLCTSNGAYLVELMGSYINGSGIIIIGILECIAICWVYGCARFYEDINLMLRRKISIWWRINWQFITPITLLGVLIFQWSQYTSTTYAYFYVFPKWADVMGILMSIFFLFWIPLVAFYYIYRKYDTSLKKTIYNLSLPTIYWGPALPIHRKLVTYVQDFDFDPKKFNLRHNKAIKKRLKKAALNSTFSEPFSISKSIISPNIKETINSSNLWNSPNQSYASCFTFETTV